MTYPSVAFNSIEWILLLRASSRGWAHTVSFNSIEWIPAQCRVVACFQQLSLSIPLNGFLESEWYAFKHPLFNMLSIPLNGFINLPSISMLVVAGLLFQFHWMDSSPFNNMAFDKQLEYTFQFHWMDSIENNTATVLLKFKTCLSIPLNGFLKCDFLLVRVHNTFQFHWMDSGYLRPSTYINVTLVPFNSIEWIPNPNSLPRTSAVADLSFNSIEWILLCFQRVTPCLWFKAFQFHWMDSRVW